MKTVYVKAIERDTTLILEEVFFDVMMRDLKDVYSIDPFRAPAYLFETNNKNIVFYENPEARERLLISLKEKVADKEFLQHIQKLYEENSRKNRAYWTQGKAGTLEEFDEYLNVTRDSMLIIGIAFHVGLLEDLPKEARDLFLIIRKEYDFFACSDEYVRKTLIAMGVPEALTNIVVRGDLDVSIDTKLLERRKQNGSILHNGTLIPLEAGQHPQDVLPEYTFLDPSVDLSDVLQGQTAFRGKVQGIVRILRNRDDVLQTQEGEVIVASMTTPDFLPAMKKATAFVTDEGGITCHAAIVSRELRTPCVTGTKNATRILQDGDLVEVDADKGVVKVLRSVD